MGSHQKPQKQTTQAYMAIDNDDAFFALLCARLHITDITLLITVSDDEIRRTCNHAQLAQLVIELKHETLAQVAQTLV
jgi:hypothetical protein